MSIVVGFRNRVGYQRPSFFDHQLNALLPSKQQQNHHKLNALLLSKQQQNHHHHPKQKGHIFRHHNLRLASFTQHHNDQFDLRLSAHENFEALCT